MSVPAQNDERPERGEEGSSCSNCGHWLDKHSKTGCVVTSCECPVAPPQNEVPPEGCTCASFWTVRHTHKPDCPLATPPQNEVPSDYYGDPRIVVGELPPCQCCKVQFTKLTNEALCDNCSSYKHTPPPVTENVADKQRLKHILETHFYSGMSVARKKQWKSDVYMAIESITLLLELARREARNISIAEQIREAMKEEQASPIRTVETLGIMLTVLLCADTNADTTELKLENVHWKGEDIGSYVLTLKALRKEQA